MRKHLELLGIEDMLVSSAGTRGSLNGVHDNVLCALAQYGIDASLHKSRRLSTDILNGSIPVAMAISHKEFILANYGKVVPLYNELALGVSTSVLDVDEVVDNWWQNPDEAKEHMYFIVDYIYRTIPRVIEVVANTDFSLS